MIAHNAINNNPAFLNKKFNYLEVIDFVKYRTEWNWKLKCVCGHEFIYKPYRVKKGIVKSCGCMRGRYERVK